MYVDLFQLFQDELPRTDRARELYAALCNNIWEKNGQKLDCTWRAAGQIVADMRNDLQLPLEDPEMCQRCHEKRSRHFPVKRKTLLAELLQTDTEPIEITMYKCDPNKSDLFLPGYTCREDYMDFYCSGGEGTVAPWVEERLQSAGWQNIDR